MRGEVESVWRGESVPASLGGLLPPVPARLWLLLLLGGRSGELSRLSGLLGSASKGEPGECEVGPPESSCMLAGRPDRELRHLPHGQIT